MLGDTSAIALLWERCWRQQANKSSFPLRCSRMKKRVSGRQWVTAGQELHFLVQHRQQEGHSATYGLKTINSKEKEENLLENNSFGGNGLSNDLAIACKYSHRQKSTWKVSLLQQNLHPIWNQNPGYTTIRHNIKGEADYSFEQILMSWKTLWCFQAKWFCFRYILVKYKSLAWLQAYQCKCCLPWCLAITVSGVMKNSSHILL